MKDMIRHTLGPQLLHTMDILLHRHTSNAPESNHQVALNFVKFITKILSLDPFLTEEISGLRRTLLTQVNFDIILFLFYFSILILLIVLIFFWK